MNMLESYFNNAKKYLVEEDEIDTELDTFGDEGVEGDTDFDTETETDTDVAPETEDEGEGEEELELDLANPVCPSCGAQLCPVADEIDVSEIEDEEEAAAVELLQSLGYVVSKQCCGDECEEDEGDVDNDFAMGDDEDFGDAEDEDTDSDTDIDEE